MIDINKKLRLLYEMIVDTKNKQINSFKRKLLVKLRRMRDFEKVDITRQVRENIAYLKLDAVQDFEFFIENSGRIMLRRNTKNSSYSDGCGFFRDNEGDERDRNMSKNIVLSLCSNRNSLDHELQHLPIKIQQGASYIKKGIEKDQRDVAFDEYIFSNDELDQKISNFISSYRKAESKIGFRFHNFKHLLMTMMKEHYSENDKRSLINDARKFSEDQVLKKKIIKRLIREGYPYDKMVG
jgi:hypothetical protein